MSQVRAIKHRHVMMPSLPRACVLMPFRVGVPRLLCSWTTAALLMAGCTSGRVTGPGAAGEGFGGVARPVHLIVIDAGHGGHDPGARYFGLEEKRLAFDVAKQLRDILKQTGFAVVMTREGDQFVPLSRRPEVANRLGADLFVSIHLNANPNRRVAGAEVYFPRESVVAPEANWPPYLSAAEIGMPSAVVKQVLWDLVLQETRAQSSQLADRIAETLGRDLQASSTVKSARFVVLREAWMPAVLVEVGYMSNRRESQRLADAAYRRAAAQAIAEGIVSYVRERGTHPI